VNHNKKKNAYFLFIGCIQTSDKWKEITEFVCVRKSISKYVGGS